MVKEEPGQLRDRLSIQFKEETNKIEPKNSNSGSLFFLSFDMVNSTEFKNRAPQKWQKYVSNFYSECEKEILSKFEKVSLWKKSGDEVLFYLKLVSIEELTSAIPEIYATLNKLKSLVNNDIAKGVLSVKATLWVAIVGSELDSQESTDSEQQGTLLINNLYFQERYGSYDFIGPDIDFGFRIATQSAPGILCIDPKIVALIEDYNGDDKAVYNHITLVDCVQLKGVWNSRFVPIYWYHSDIKNPESIFPYDEAKRNPLVKILLDKYDKLNNRKAKEILIEINEYSKVESIKHCLQLFDIYSDKGVPASRIAEAHLVAVLFNEDNEVLCARRDSKKKNFANLWEFGCAQLHAGSKKMQELLKEEYNNDFSVEILSIIGSDVSPEVIGTYGFKENGSDRWIPGFVFTGKGKGIPIKQEGKHSEVCWKPIREALSINKTDAVDDFHKRIKAAATLHGITY